MAGERTDFEDKLVSPEWKTVLAEYNISPSYARALVDSAQSQKNYTVLRLDEKIDTNDPKPYAPKPSYVKLKVGNWGPHRYYIPVDQVHLAKTKDGHIKPGDHTPQTKNPEKYSAILGTHPFSMSVAEILHQVKKGVLEIDAKQNVDGRLIMRAPMTVYPNPHEQEVIFSVQLPPDLSMLNPLSIAPEQLTREYPIEYKVADEEKYKPLEIYHRPYVDKNGEQKILPLSKDNDGLLRTISLALYKELSEKVPDALTVVNTFQPQGIERLKNNLYTLLAHFNPPPREPIAADKRMEYLLEKFEWRNKIETQLQQYDFANFGRGNAYDMYLVHLSNQFAQHFATRPAQHGDEAYNPGKQSDIDSLSLVVTPEGQPVVLKTEAELIHYLASQPEMLTSQVFHVNCNWDLSMEKWGQFVYAQIQQQVQVDIETLGNFIKTNYVDEAKVMSDTIFNYCKKNELAIQHPHILASLEKYVATKVDDLTVSILELMKNLAQENDPAKKRGEVRAQLNKVREDYDSIGRQSALVDDKLVAFDQTYKRYVAEGIAKSRARLSAIKDELGLNNENKIEPLESTTKPSVKKF